MTTKVGVISDTHGLLRPQAIAALTASDLIIHAGDIGKPGVMDELGKIAPLAVIRGNVDKWAHDVADVASCEVEGHKMYVLHNVKSLDFDPVACGYDVVIAGHSHKPDIAEKDGVLYINPGSAGPRRFSLPTTLAMLTVSATSVDARIIYLDV